jgi:hypothetical protein
MKKLSYAILVVLITSSAYCQSYSTATPATVGQPAVAIHSRGNAPQVYQYSEPNSPRTTQSVVSAPSNTFVHDLGTGNSYMQYNMSGFTIIQPLNSSD